MDNEYLGMGIPGTTGQGTTTLTTPASRTRVADGAFSRPSGRLPYFLPR